MIAHGIPTRFGHVGAANQMNVDDELEINWVHFGETLVAQNAGIVDQDVDPAPIAFRFGDHFGHLCELGYAATVGFSRSAQGSYFLDDGQRRV